MGAGGLLVALAVAFTTAATASAQPRQHLRATALTTEHMTNPLGISESEPRFSWVNKARRDGAKQVAYEIRVSSSDSLKGDVWSSGRVASKASFDIEYEGPRLKPRTRYYWAVRVWDAAGGPSKWSRRAWFETAFLDADQFQGEWIARRATRAATETPEPLLRKDFSLASKRIASARAYIAGLGYYKLFLNGARVGDHELDPAYTLFDKRVMYVTYDVTRMLRRSAENAVGVSLGRGYYAPFNEGDVNTAPWMGPSAEPKLKLQLDVTYADGSRERVVSDTSWKTADGPTLLNEVKRGETYDARLEQPGWNAPGFDDSGWDAAVAAVAPPGALVAQDVEPIRVTGKLKPPVAIPQSSTTTLYDFRTTRAGWATVSLEGPPGATVTMVYGEKVTGANNTLTTSGQSYTYVLRGGGVETFTPSYSYNGYRYLRITKPETVTVKSVVGKTLNTDVPSAGRFTSSDPLLNRYNAAMRAGILSNLHAIPTDTPMYEKRGWTADAHLFADSALLNFGMQNFFDKWMLDHRDNQTADGAIGTVVPRYPVSGDDPVWSASYVLINWNLYHDYGDRRALEANYAGMKRWMDRWMARFASTGYIFRGTTFGDWLAPPAGGADNRITGTAYVYEAAAKLAKIARVLGHTADADEIEQFAGRVAAAFNAEFYDSQAKAYLTKTPDNVPLPSLTPGANWIWNVAPASNGTIYVRKTFTVSDPASVSSAALRVNADDGHVTYVNGTQVTSSAPGGAAWQTTQVANIKPHLVAGTNVIAIAPVNTGGQGGLIAAAEIDSTRIVTDASWKALPGTPASPPAGWNTAGFDDSSWQNATVIGPYGIGPWNQALQEPGQYRQTENALPLELGLVPASDRRAVFDNLLHDADVTRNDHLSTGAIGTKDILPMLTEGGDADLAYRVATNPTFPGWGYWFLTVHGSNLGSNNVIVDTMWEAWNETARSQNHAFLGVVDDWLYQYVAGIKATAPAYRKIRIKPYPVGRLKHASASTSTPLGKVSSSWKRSGAGVELRVRIPVGARAKVLVPLGGAWTARADGGGRPTKISDGYATFKVGAGDYTFRTVSR